MASKNFIAIEIGSEYFGQLPGYIAVLQTMGSLLNLPISILQSEKFQTLQNVHTVAQTLFKYWGSLVENLDVIYLPLTTIKASVAIYHAITATLELGMDKVVYHHLFEAAKNITAVVAVLFQLHSLQILIEIAYVFQGAIAEHTDCMYKSSNKDPKWEKSTFPTQLRSFLGSSQGFLREGFFAFLVVKLIELGRAQDKTKDFFNQVIFSRVSAISSFSFILCGLIQFVASRKSKLQKQHGLSAQTITI